MSQRQNGSDLYFHGDQLGSTRYLTDSTGANAPTAYRYDAYGVPSFQGGLDSTKYKFGGAQGYESDAFNGMQLLGARYYDPQVGRFLSPDPIGFAGGANVYAYCGGDPVNYGDPSGLFRGAPGSWGPSAGSAEAAEEAAAEKVLEEKALESATTTAVGGGGLAALAPFAIPAGADAIVELYYYRPGKPSGFFTNMGEMLGQGIASIFWPNTGYGADPKATALLAAAHDNRCNGGGGGGGGGDDDSGFTGPRMRHYTSRRGSRGIEADQLINASARQWMSGCVFCESAGRRASSPRDAEARYGLRPGHGRDYIEFDSRPGEARPVTNPLTGGTEWVIPGDIRLEGRDPRFFRR